MQIRGGFRAVCQPRCQPGLLRKARGARNPGGTVPVMTPLIVLGLIVCGIAGALIGARSGHRINGMFFGLVLGPAGVLIVALWKPKRT